MDPRTFHDGPSPKLSSDARPGSSAMQPNDGEKKAQAITELLCNKSLTQTFGLSREYEVRTTITTRQAWRYRCSVLRDGKELKRKFCPVEVDFTGQLRQEMPVTEAMRVAFAREAVDDHFALCAALSEYTVLATIYAEPVPSHYRPWHIAFVVLMLAVLVTTYWLWSNPGRADAPAPSAANAPRRIVQWAQNPVFYEYPAGKQFSLRLPELAEMAAGLAVEVTPDASGQWPNWLHFDREALRLSGTAPLADQARAYQLIFRARAKDGGESQLRAYLTIMQPIELLPPAASPDHKLSAPDPLEEKTNTLREKDCLLNILKGTPCENR
jgi:hypothetical protein